MTSSGPRIVMISPALPYSRIPHAGGSYVWKLSQLLLEGGDLTVISPDTPSNRYAEAVEKLDFQHLVVGPVSRAQRAISRGLRRLQNLLYRIAPGAPDLIFCSLLFLNQATRRIIREADVVDLQWSPYGRLWPVLRLVNRRARLLCTFHDVDSQRLRRMASVKPDRLRQMRWLLGARIAEVCESSAARHLDQTIVFSSKDRDLLSQAVGSRTLDRISVVAPPLGTSAIPPRSSSATPTVVMVAFFGRAVNVEAARWLLTSVWPVVSSAVPDARLRLVGADPDEALAQYVQGVDDVTLTGFVEDLWSEYAQASVVVVPLLSGAGVKFKTIEALLAGTPVVATSVGAEGVAGDDVLTSITDDSEAFATAVIDVLTHPEPAASKAAASQIWAKRTYSLDMFRRTVRQLYGVAGEVTSCH